MKIKKIMFAISMALLCSCSDEYNAPVLHNENSITLSPEEYISIFSDSSETITVQEAVSLVNNFRFCDNTRSVASTTVVGKSQFVGLIKTKGVRKQVVIPTYELSLGANGGYAIVAADRRIPEILAYSENGRLDEISLNCDAVKMLRMSENVALSQISRIELLRDSLRQKTLAKIASFLGKDNVNFAAVKNQISVKGIDETRSICMNPNANDAWKIVKPMIVTAWDQCYPYNKHLDKAANPVNSRNNGFYAVGCAGVATAQMVAFYKAISTANGCSLDWNLILSQKSLYDDDSDEDIVEQVSQLMKCVANGIHTEWGADSDDGNSNIQKVYDYLNTIGLTFDTGKKFAGYSMNAARIISSLDQGYPVFITGVDSDSKGSHMWILDGYQMIRQRTSARNQIMANNTYIHANFGWEGFADGYYLVDAGTTNLTFQNAYDYSSDLKLYINVRKK